MFSNIKSLIKGSLLAKAVGVAIMPVITRLYAPEDMGMAAMFLSVVLIIGPLLNLRYCLAIPLPRRSSTAAVLVYASMFITFFLGGFLTVLFYLFESSLVDVFGLAKIQPYLFMAILTGILLSIFEILSWWVTREKEFKLYSNVMIVQSLVGGTVKVGLGFVAPVPVSLMLGSMVQNVWGLSKFFMLFRSTIGRVNIRLRRVFCILRYYANYFYLRTPAHMMYILAAQLPILYSGKYHSVTEVGQLSLAISVIAIPAAILGQSVSKVYYSEISTIGRECPQEIYDLTVTMLKKLIAIGFVIALSVYILSPLLFETVFGKSWALAGGLSKALAPVMLFQLCSTVLITSLNVFFLNYLSFFLHFTRLLLVVLSFVAARHMALDLLDAISLYSFVLMMHYLGTIIMVLCVIKKKAYV